MKKQEIISAVAQKASLAKVDAEAAIEALIETIKEAVLKDESLTLNGLGTFSSAIRPERTVRNPRTNEAIRLEETKVIKFKVSKTYKEELSASYRV